MSTLPREYFVSSRLAASSTASLMAIPRLPGESGSWARMPRPASVWLLGLGMTFAAPGFHQHPAVGLLLVADLDHVNLAFHPEEVAAEGKRASPLAGAGFRGEALDPFLFVVVGLGDGGVGFVAPGRAHAFIFVINPGGGFQGLLQPSWPGREAWASRDRRWKGFPPGC